MKSLKTFRVCLPDGKVITHTSARDIRYVVCYENDEWHADCWTSSQRRAERFRKAIAGLYELNIIDAVIAEVACVDGGER